ncbi:MAG: hypothetical protein D6737_11980 [Chloroflexi bacterium]|nr:MAG: hypothetical protein D6737_11980 [Chloroflexota bacterium]
MTLHIRFTARRVALILGTLATYLALHSIIGKRIEYAVGTNNTYAIYHIVQLFNVNREGNIPTWFSSSILLFAALLFAVIAYAVRQRGGTLQARWWGLAAILLYLSIDEAAAIHEKLTVPLQDSLHVTGYLYFAWVLVGIPLALIVTLTYLRFVWHLPAHIRRLFFLAGAVYLGGALGVEIISANQWYLNDGTSLIFSTIGTVEEWMEMMGVVIIIYALLRYIGETVGEVRVAVVEPQRQPATQEVPPSAVADAP